MPEQKKRIILKLTGEILPLQNGIYNLKTAQQIVTQIKNLKNQYQFGIVLGGGNIIRGVQYKHHTSGTISPLAEHTAGMLATYMNTIIFTDLLDQQNITTAIYSVTPIPGISQTPSPTELKNLLQTTDVICFAGGTGNAFVSTDTAAALRALYIEASEVWKGTKVAGIYTADPHTNHTARKLDTVSYTEALDQSFGIIDKNALVLGQQYALTFRFFNIFDDNALLKAADYPDYGSQIIINKHD